jgi:hypothetical protein
LIPPTIPTYKRGNEMETEKLIAEYQEKLGIVNMMPIYKRGINDGLITLTKLHTQWVIRELERIGILIRFINQDSEYTDSIYVFPPTSGIENQ